MRRVAAAACLALAASAGGGGCAAPRPSGLSAPLVQLMRLEPVSQDGGDARVEVELRLQNLNPEDVAIDGYRFELAIDGRPFASGASDEPLRIARFGQLLTKSVVTSARRELVERLGTLGLATGYDYRIQGTVRFAAPEQRALAFEAEGQLLPDGTSY